ncbi:MAG TPA: YceH family protein [Solirubrobacteraceae bacterium]|nr:YceH family protein [Solirubrobacteraceae bacterium]
MIEPDAAELRVLGALIEKQRTTPDAYPLSLNALRLAANQSTGREPVVDYDEATVREAIARLVRRGWARLASGPGSRATKYRHLLDEALSLSAPELSLLAVLMLRGAQTPGELRVRSERLHHFATLEALESHLDALADRRLIVRFERRPGQKEARWSLGEGFGSAGEDDDRGTAASLEPAPSQAPSPHPATLEARIGALERELAALRGVVEQLRVGGG